jgi:hypothetical protein
MAMIRDLFGLEVESEASAAREPASAEELAEVRKLRRRR